VSERVLSVRELMDAAAARLREGEGSGREDPRREASLLMEAAAGLDGTQILKSPEHVIEPYEVVRFWEMVEERSRGVPLQLLVGETWFHDVKLRVARGVFIPRPETELLVDRVRARVEKLLDAGAASVRVLDLCTGTGAIAIAAAASFRERENVFFYGGDWNPAAVRLARWNAERNDVEDLVEVRRSDLFSAFADVEGRVDVLVSNPPYIARAESTELPVEVRLGDPHDALFAGEEGTAFHRRIAERGRDFLRPEGLLLLEIGERQGDSVREILAGLHYDSIEIRQDLAGRDRYTEAVWRG
jgi:release factor glutamine methyltransferase